MPDSPSGTGSKLADPQWRQDRARKAGQARTTPDYHLTRLREIVSTTRAAQGLPPVTVDDLTLGRVAELLRVAATGKKAA